MSAEVISYQIDRPQLHYDPDGTLRIDVPPTGWRKALRVRSTRAIVIGAFFASVGLFGPAVAVYFAMHNMPLAMIAAILNGAVVSIIFAVMLRASREQTHIRVTPQELFIERLGGIEPERLHYLRDEIAVLTSRRQTTQQGRGLGMCVQRKRYDTSELYLVNAPEEDVKAYTAAIRSILGFKPGEAEGETHEAGTSARFRQ